MPGGDLAFHAKIHKLLWCFTFFFEDIKSSFSKMELNCIHFPNQYQLLKGLY